MPSLNPGLAAPKPFDLDKGRLNQLINTLFVPELIAIPAASDATPAHAALFAEAESFLELRPRWVTEKTQVAASDDPHDYFSLSIYHWPVEGATGPHTYRTRDCHSNPEADSHAYDRLSIRTLVRMVQILAIAHAAGGGPRHAEKAAELLRGWFLDPRTRMNPNLKYAQWIPGRLQFDTVFPPVFVPGVGGSGIVRQTSEACGGLYVNSGGIIDAQLLATLPDCIRLVADSGALSASELVRLRSWFGELVAWLRDSLHGQIEAYQPGNHGGWYWTYLMIFAEFAGDRRFADEIARTRLPARIAAQIQPDGMVEDVRRPSSFDYAIFTNTAFVNAALAAGRAGANLWTARIGPDHGTITDAIDWIARHLQPGCAWPFPNLRPIDPAKAAPLLALAGHGLGRTDYFDLVARLDFPAEHLYRVLYSTPGSRRPASPAPAAATLPAACP